MFHEDRLKQLARLFAIANELERGQGVTRASLAQLCDCSPRTILRDLALLRAGGVEYSYNCAAKSYQLDAPLPFETLSFSIPELMVLALACEQSLNQPNLPFAAFARRAFQRLQARLPEPLRAELQQAKQVVSTAGRVRRDYSTAHWKELMEAAQRGQTMRLLYHTKSRNDVSWREVDPYFLVERDGYYVLLAHCHSRGEVRVFSLDSIRSLRPTEKTFQRPPDFSPEKYLHNSLSLLRGAMTPIVLRFQPEVALWAQQRAWRFDHEITSEPDGSLLLRGTVSGLEGIKRELLSWGAKVIVLEPPELRDLLRAEAAAMVAAYDATATKTRPRKNRRKNSAE